jgi:hypothetical protein
MQKPAKLQAFLLALTPQWSGQCHVQPGGAHSIKR